MTNRYVRLKRFTADEAIAVVWRMMKTHPLAKYQREPEDLTISDEMEHVRLDQNRFLPHELQDYGNKRHFMQARQASIGRYAHVTDNQGFFETSRIYARAYDLLAIRAASECDSSDDAITEVVLNSESMMVDMAERILSELQKLDASRRFC